ncbi:MAG: hypothetical protein LQ343_002526 [Gyalolechia ehrenbergii]|nr:MAG: hypothetical protein LQ343_002526 [Gyalolechia ehrenbergii]
MGKKNRQPKANPLKRKEPDLKAASDSRGAAKAQYEDLTKVYSKACSETFVTGPSQRGPEKSIRPFTGVVTVPFFAISKEEHAELGHLARTLGKSLCSTYPEADAQDPVAGRNHFQRLHVVQKEFVFASSQAMLHFFYFNSWAKAGERNDAIGSDFVTPRNLFRKQAKDKVSDYVSLHGKSISSQMRSPVH